MISELGFLVLASVIQPGIGGKVIHQATCPDQACVDEILRIADRFPKAYWVQVIDLDTGEVVLDERGA